MSNRDPYSDRVLDLGTARFSCYHILSYSNAKTTPKLLKTLEHVDSRIVLSFANSRTS